MSRYTVTVRKGSRTDTDATIGYDKPLKTYFLHAFPHPETDAMELEVGTVTQRVDSLEMLLECARWNGYEVSGLTSEIILDLMRSHANL
jgi:hypothetical protein